MRNRRNIDGAVLLMLAWLLPVTAGERIRFGAENYRAEELAAYSRAVDLPPLDPAGGEQVRAWFMGYCSGRMPITGYVLTANGARRCRLSYNNDDGKYMVINRGSCSGPRKYEERLAAAMATLPELAKYEAKPTACGTMDGGGVDIEGVHDGKRFHFEAQNLQDCEGESFRKLEAMIKLVAGAYYKKDRD
jgi:hypothetical protein